jgi:hypothetical protein
MKLTFFLIALFLVLLRVCLPNSGFWHKGRNDGTMTIKGDNYIEEIKWSGKTRLSDDEKSVAEISPGGYLKFRENDTTLKAESNLQGEISYSLYDGRESLPLNDSGRRFIAVVLQKMISRGFYSEDRAERIYKKGGNKALLEELPRLEMEGTKEPYLDLLFRNDSLTKDEQAGLLTQITALDDGEKEKYLERFTPDQLRDSAIGDYWLTVVGHIGPDDRKKNLLKWYIADSAGLTANRFDSVVAVADRFESGGEKDDLYKILIDRGGKTDDEWIGLIRAVARLNEDGDKSELLVRIAQKIPKNEKLKADYLAAAKTIREDSEYGKAMRAVE